ELGCLVDGIDHVVGEPAVPPVFLRDGERVTWRWLRPEGVVPDVAQPLVGHPLRIALGRWRKRRISDMCRKLLFELKIALIASRELRWALLDAFDVDRWHIVGDAESCCKGFPKTSTDGHVRSPEARPAEVHVGLVG